MTRWWRWRIELHYLIFTPRSTSTLPSRCDRYRWYRTDWYNTLGCSHHSSDTTYREKSLHPFEIILQGDECKCPQSPIIEISHREKYYRNSQMMRICPCPLYGCKWLGSRDDIIWCMVIRPSEISPENIDKKYLSEMLGYFI
jgi:hypothetical protein